MARNGLVERSGQWEVYFEGQLLSTFGTKSRAEKYYAAYLKRQVEIKSNEVSYQQAGQTQQAMATEAHKNSFFGRLFPKGSGETFTERQLTANFGWALTLAIVNFAYRWITGFAFNWIYVALDAFSFFVFWPIFGFQWAFLLFVIQFLLPLALTSLNLFPTLVFILNHAPVWALFAAGYKAITDQESGFSRLAIAAALILFIYLASPSILQAQIVPQYSNVNYQAFQDLKEKVTETTQKSTQALKTNIGLIQCDLSADPVGCREKLITPEQELSAQIAQEITTIPEGLSMSVKELIPPGSEKLVEDAVAVSIDAQNNHINPSTLSFSCGLTGRGPGIPDPPVKIVNEGVLPDQDKTVICSKLDITKHGTATFYFNMTAKGAVSTGQRDVMILDSNAKKAILASSSGATEDEKLLNSQLGDFIKLNLNDLKSQVGENDLIQPIIKVGAATSVQTKAPLIYGVSELTEIPFGLFIKNNGRGKIASVSSIIITLPSTDIFGFKDSPNCGIDDTTYKRTNWRSIGQDEFFQKICKLVVKHKTQYPNNPEILQISVRVVYDYIVSQGRDVTIPGQVST